jgi:hypothetical protein
VSNLTKRLSLAACFAVLSGATAGASVVSETFASPFVVDRDSGTYSFNVGAGQTITDVNITLDFTKCDDPLTSSDCTAGGFSFNREIVFKLISPLLTVVDLVFEDTYGGQSPGGRAVVTFDDEAGFTVGGPLLTSGVFRPVGSLADLIGQNSAGVWSIFYQDTVGADPLAFNGYSLQINGPASVPLPASLPLLAAAIGAFGLLSRRRNQG